MRLLNFPVSRVHAIPKSSAGPDGPPSMRLVPTPMSGRNPGNLKSWSYVPPGRRDMPLVVVLHGCTQSASAYDLGSGWSTLAHEHGFAVLFPEQQRANNPNLCFNWFVPDDVRRGSGEVMSIREMIAVMTDRDAIDPARVFVSGLSAGGAMASALLASYPDVFAGGAIIAGLPAGAASTMPQAFERMRGRGHVTAERSAAYVREASGHRGRWPSVSVWHGSTDATVAPSNGDATLAQWRALHGAAYAPDQEDTVDGAAHRIWRDCDGKVCLEDYRIAGMGHGTPLATSGRTACGLPGPYMLDVGISSTWHSAARWGLLNPEVLAREQEQHRRAAQPTTMSLSPPDRAPQPQIQGIIEAALRSAGLMR